MAVELGKAVFIDKDGTLIHDVPYNVDPRRIELTEGIGAALHRMKNAGYKLIVISNQSGIARRLFNENDLLPVNQQIQALLGPYDARVDAFYYCPHGPGDGCECRKPMPGMILRAARDQAIDPRSSWMIGDILHDVEAGNRAGCRTIHFNNGNETEWITGNYRQPSHSVKNLAEAADVICRHALGLWKEAV
ncbi:MAG: HAD family hydrolase [Nitrosospira sp.]|nr:HAD family hydrolase [Nitrosospira sp.]